MTEPFFISRNNVRLHKSSQSLKAWTSNAAAAAKEQGAKFGRVSTNPASGEVVFEAWTEENPVDPGEPRWTPPEGIAEDAQ